MFLYLIGFGNAQSFEYPCIEKALTLEEVTNCGDKLVPPLEADVEQEFERLHKEYKDSKEMQVMLDLTKNSWNGFRNIQCRLEELATDKGRLLSPKSVEAEKAYLKCLIRQLKEMKDDLSKL